MLVGEPALPSLEGPILGHGKAIRQDHAAPGQGGSGTSRRDVEVWAEREGVACAECFHRYNLVGRNGLIGALDCTFECTLVVRRTDPGVGDAEKAQHIAQAGRKRPGSRIHGGTA